MNNKKSQISLYFIGIAIIVIILLIATIASPLVIRMNSEFYVVGEEMMLEANKTIAKINNTEVRERLTASMQGSLDATETNIGVNAGLIRYQWLLVLLVLVIVLYLNQRRNVEIGGIN